MQKGEIEIADPRRINRKKMTIMAIVDVPLIVPILNYFAILRCFLYIQGRDLIVLSRSLVFHS
jgi:hypothetical protein